MMLLDAVEVGFCVVIVGVVTTIGILGVVVVGFELEIDCGVVIPLSKEELSDL